MRKLIVLVVLLLAFSVGLGGYLIFGPSVKNQEKKALYIPSGATMDILKDSLKQDGFLEKFWVFDRLASYFELEKKLKPGKYSIDDGMSVFHLVKKLRDGRQETINLVINKLRLKETLARRIGRSFEIDSAKAMVFLASNDSLSRFNVDTNTVLTAVIPDTYAYYWAADMGTIFKKLAGERDKFWNENRLAKADSLGLSPEQVYIIASIVEEETNMQDDKGKIASVYINRLRRGMPLGADPTIKYAMKDFGLRRILHKHLDVVSPYNTYRNQGLPPGPICTPSRKTLEAVLDAPETNYLFFVARSDFSGYSDFATNYRDHLRYAREYQKALTVLLKERAEKEKAEKEKQK